MPRWLCTLLQSYTSESETLGIRETAQFLKVSQQIHNKPEMKHFGAALFPALHLSKATQQANTQKYSLLWNASQLQ